MLLMCYVNRCIQNRVFAHVMLLLCYSAEQMFIVCGYCFRMDWPLRGTCHDDANEVHCLS